MGFLAAKIAKMHEQQPVLEVMADLLFITYRCTTYKTVNFVSKRFHFTYYFGILHIQSYTPFPLRWLSTVFVKE